MLILDARDKNKNSFIAKVYTKLAMAGKSGREASTLDEKIKTVMEAKKKKK